MPLSPEIPEASSREYPLHPLVGVGGVIVEGGNVLLVRRAHEPWRGDWSIPGGLVELGETLEEALRREIFEETGLTVQVGPVIEVFDRIFRDEDGCVRFHYVLVDYLCRVERGQAQAATDATETCWVERSELAEYSLRPETLEVINKAFSLGQGIFSV